MVHLRPTTTVLCYLVYQNYEFRVGMSTEVNQIEAKNNDVVELCNFGVLLRDEKKDSLE